MKFKTAELFESATIISGLFEPHVVKRDGKFLLISATALPKEIEEIEATFHGEKNDSEVEILAVKLLKEANARPVHISKAILRVLYTNPYLRIANLASLIEISEKLIIERLLLAKLPKELLTKDISVASLYMLTKCKEITPEMITMASTLTPGEFVPLAMAVAKEQAAAKRAKTVWVSEVLKKRADLLATPVEQRKAFLLNRIQTDLKELSTL